MFLDSQWSGTDRQKLLARALHRLCPDRGDSLQQHPVCVVLRPRNNPIYDATRRSDLGWNLPLWPDSNLYGRPIRKGVLPSQSQNRSSDTELASVKALSARSAQVSRDNRKTD